MSDENVNETETPADEAAASADQPVSEESAAPAEAAGDEAPAAEAEQAGDAASDADDTSSGTSESSSDDEAEAEVDLEALKALVATPATDARYQATGKRKRSVARVILTPGEGTFWINGRTLDDYFPRGAHRTAVMEPMVVAGAVGAYHVRARIHGGGITGQTGALRHGIAKALAEIDPALRRQLKSRGFLKVDTRQVERKKAGLKKARKRPQFSKR